MDLAGCTTRVAVCDDTGQAGGVDLVAVGVPVVVGMAVLLLVALLVRRHRRRRASRPPARRVWVSAAGHLVDGPP